MKLYDAMTPNTLRVQVFLAEKGLDVPRVKIDVMGGGTRTPEFLAMNSRGELPVLELDDGSFLAESVAICRYFEELHPEPPLMGRDAYDRAHVEMWNRRIEHHLFATIGAVGRHTFEFFADKLEQMPDYAATQQRSFEQNWAWLNEEMSDGRPYIAGENFTIADITGMAALLVCQFTNVDLPDDQRHANRWAEAMRARPSFAQQIPKAA